MGYDTECDLIVEAREDQPQVKLNLLKERNALLAEHLGCDRAKVEEALERSGGSMTGASDRSEEHTSELQSLMRISYAVFCLKKKKQRRRKRQKNTQNNK